MELRRVGEKRHSSQFPPLWRETSESLEATHSLLPCPTLTQLPKSSREKPKANWFLALHIQQIRWLGWVYTGHENRGRRGERVGTGRQYEKWWQLQRKDGLLINNDWAETYKMNRKAGESRKNKKCCFLRGVSFPGYPIKFGAPVLRILRWKLVRQFWFPERNAGTPSPANLSSTTHQVEVLYLIPTPCHVLAYSR